MATNVELAPILAGKVTRIDVPINISEQSDINGFAFSKKLLEAAHVTKLDLTQALAQGTVRFQFAELVRQIASDSAGGPTIGANSLQIWINATDPSAGSEADYIWLNFGPQKRIRLWGVDRTRFPKGAVLVWDLNGAGDFLETIPTDAWDELFLSTDSGDGIKIDRMVVKHSDVTIVDWGCNQWLDAGMPDYHSRLGMVAEILKYKLGCVANRWSPQIHWAARELGKTDGRKYGASGKWCSEFASWCVRKALWDTPTGNIDSADMQSYFSARGRMYTRTQVLAQEYRLFEGDYLRFEWAGGGQHSGIFIEYVGDATNPTLDSEIRTIEGNTGCHVAVQTRAVRDILSVGCTR